jgi:hypothetical protein
MRVELTINNLHVTFEGDSDWVQGAFQHMKGMAEVQQQGTQAEEIVFRYEPSHEDPEPEVALSGELDATATVPVDQAETGEAPPRWKDLHIPPPSRPKSSKVRKPTEQTKDLHHQQVAKGSAAKHAETPGPVVGGAPKMTNLQKILRLVAKQATPFNRFTLLDAVMDEELASSRDSAYQQVSVLRKKGFLADGEQDGRIVTVLTEAGQAEVRQCPSSAE